MDHPEVVPATPADRERVVETFVAAFVADPALRYFFPDDDSYADHAGPGGNGPTLQLPAETLARLAAYDDTVHAALPTTAHRYLGVLARHPDQAGRGWGRAVMAAGLRRAAAAGLPACLETSNPRNVEVYRRAGWQVAETLTAGALPVWIMRRSPS